LIEAWAGQKSFKKKERPSTAQDDDDPGNPTIDFGFVSDPNGQKGA